MRLALVAVTAVVTLASCSSDPQTTGSGAPDTTTPDGTSISTTPPKEGNNDSAAGKWEGPEFTVETFDGDEFALGERSGTPVVLNFWESW